MLQKGNKDCGCLGVRGDRDSFLEDSGLIVIHKPLILISHVTTFLYMFRGFLSYCLEKRPQA